ncbi:MAG: hypothetical protein H0X13_15435 [Ramlibacter sp.]|nr:hypothetical protein [Ramlibacter sp.]
MSNGQADEAPETIDDLAQFLEDNPDADGPSDEDNAKNSEESEEDNSDEDQEDAPAEDEDESESEKAKEQTSGLKFKVPVKGEDGTDTSIEVDEKELIAGYQRHSDYTRKTMELADKEREVTQTVATKLEEGRSYFLQQAQLARSAAMQLAGLKSPQEMAQLAQTDPATWIQEQQRQIAINGFLAQLEQAQQHETQKSQAEAAKAAEAQISRAWGVLGQQGIDKPMLIKLYETVSSKYGVPAERLNAVTDPALVLLMRDAVAYQGLKDKKAAVTKKAQDAPKLPAQRQSVPKKEQQNKTLDNRFRSGRAKLNDLAAYLESNNL